MTRDISTPQPIFTQISDTAFLRTDGCSHIQRTVFCMSTLATTRMPPSLATESFHLSLTEHWDTRQRCATPRDDASPSLCRGTRWAFRMNYISHRLQRVESQLRIIDLIADGLAVEMGR